MKLSDFFYLDGTSRIPTIFQHTDDQLETAISEAVQRHPDFYVLLHGIDAYMERRRRRGATIKQRLRREWRMR